jgi:hypothetical protein
MNQGEPHASRRLISSAIPTGRNGEAKPFATEEEAEAFLMEKEAEAFLMEKTGLRSPLE